MKKNLFNNSAYTLVEVMMGVFVFSLIALGVTATVIQSQKITQANLIKHAAYAYVQSYLEQMKIMPITHLKASLDDPTIPLSTVNVAILKDQIQEGDLEADDSLFLNIPNSRQILINIDDVTDSKSKEYYLNITITPTIVDMNDPIFEENALAAYLIKLDFSYEVRHQRGTNSHSDSLQTIIAVY